MNKLQSVVATGKGDFDKYKPLVDKYFQEKDSFNCLQKF